MGVRLEPCIIFCYYTCNLFNRKKKCFMHAQPCDSRMHCSKLHVIDNPKRSAWFYESYNVFVVILEKNWDICAWWYLIVIFFFHVRCFSDTKKKLQEAPYVGGICII